MKEHDVYFREKYDRDRNGKLICMLSVLLPEDKLGNLHWLFRNDREKLLSKPLTKSWGLSEYINELDGFYRVGSIILHSANKRILKLKQRILKRKIIMKIKKIVSKNYSKLQSKTLDTLYLK